MQVYYKVMVLMKYFDFSRFLHSTHFNYPNRIYSIGVMDEVARFDDCSIIFDHFKDCYWHAKIKCVTVACFTQQLPKLYVDIIAYY